MAEQFFVNADAFVNLRGAGTKKSSTSYMSTLKLTSLFESQWLGLSSPISVNKEEFNWGSCLRLGPTFIGSGSILGLAKKNLAT